MPSMRLALILAAAREPHMRRSLLEVDAAGHARAGPIMDAPANADSTGKTLLSMADSEEKFRSWTQSEIDEEIGNIQQKAQKAMESVITDQHKTLEKADEVQVAAKELGEKVSDMVDSQNAGKEGISGQVSTMVGTANQRDEAAAQQIDEAVAAAAERREAIKEQVAKVLDDASTNIATQYANGQDFADKTFADMKQNLETIEQRLEDRIDRDTEDSTKSHEEAAKVLKDMTEVQRETRAGIAATQKNLETTESNSIRRFEKAEQQSKSKMTKIENEAQKLDDAVVGAAGKDLDDIDSDAEKELAVVVKSAKAGSKEVNAEANLLERDGRSETEDAAGVTMDATNKIGLEVQKVNKDIESTEEVVEKVGETGKENAREAEETMAKETKAGLVAIKDAIERAKEQYRTLLADQEKAKRDGLDEVRSEARDAQTKLQMEADKGLSRAQMSSTLALQNSKAGTDATVELAKAVVEVIKSMNVNGDFTKLTDAQEEKYRDFIASLTKREEVAETDMAEAFKPAKDSAEGLFAEIDRQRAQRAGDLEKSKERVAATGDKAVRALKLMAEGYLAKMKELGFEKSNLKVNLEEAGTDMNARLNAPMQDAAARVDARGDEVKKMLDEEVAAGQKGVAALRERINKKIDQVVDGSEQSAKSMTEQADEALKAEKASADRMRADAEGDLDHLGAAAKAAETKVTGEASNVQERADELKADVRTSKDAADKSAKAMMQKAKEVAEEAAEGVKDQKKATHTVEDDAEKDANRKIEPLILDQKQKLQALEYEYSQTLSHSGEVAESSIKEAQQEMQAEADKTDSQVGDMKTRLAGLVAGIKQAKSRFSNLIATESQNVHGLEKKLGKEVNSDTAEYQDLKAKIEGAIGDAESKLDQLTGNSQQQVDGWLKSFGQTVDSEVGRVDERARKLEANEDKQTQSAIGSVNRELTRLESDSQGLDKDVASQQKAMTAEANELAHEGVEVTGALKADHAAAHKSMVGAQETEVTAVDGELDSAKKLAKGARDLEAGAQAAYDGLAADFKGKYGQTSAQVHGMLSEDEAKLHAAHEEEDSAGRRATFEESQLSKEVKHGEEGLSDAEKAVKDWQDESRNRLTDERTSTEHIVNAVQSEVSSGLVKEAKGVSATVSELLTAGTQLDTQLTGQQQRAAQFDRDIEKVANFEHSHSQDEIQDLEAESQVLNFQGSDMLSFARRFAKSDLSFKRQLREKFHTMDVVLDDKLLKTIEGIHGDMLEATDKKTAAHKAFEEALDKHEREQKQALADLYLQADNEIARIQADESLDDKTKAMLIKQVHLTRSQHESRIMSNDGHMKLKLANMNGDLEKLRRMIDKGISLAARLKNSDGMANGTVAEQLTHLEDGVDMLKTFSWFNGNNVDHATSSLAEEGPPASLAETSAADEARLRALDDELVSGDAELERLVGAYALQQLPAGGRQVPPPPPA